MFLVTATSPANGAVVFGLDKVTVTLSAAVDPTTLNEGVSLITPDMDLINVTRQLAAGRDDTVELIPAAPLEPGEYYLLVTGRLTSMFGERLIAGNGGMVTTRFTLSQTLPTDGPSSPSDDSYQLGALTAVPASQTYGLKAGSAAIIFSEPVEIVKAIVSVGGNLDDAMALEPTAQATTDDATLLVNWSLKPNSRYTLDLAVRGLSSNQVSSLKLDYFSYLDPGYVTVNQVRSDLGSLIKGIPNLAVFLMVSDCSQLAQAIAHSSGKGSIAARELALKQYTRYAVEFRLLREFVMGNLMNENDQKRLGEFTVTHEGGLSPKAADLLNNLEEEVLRWEDILVGFAGLGPATPASAIKGARVFLIDPYYRRIVRDEFGYPINNPYIPTRNHNPVMWEPRFKRRLP